MKSFLNILKYTLLVLVVLLLVFWVYVRYGLEPQVPELSDRSAEKLTRQTIDSSCYKINNCWLRHSHSGLWEEYVEGAPFERGVIEGKLNADLQRIQEAAFAAQIHRLIPNNGYLLFLGYFTRIFNRHLAANITDEYKQEIYGESLYAPHEYDYIGEPYDRLLNYHAAHDIGHALQSLALVGCTSFSAWDEHTTDSSLLIGRNFDFYVGDKFAENKIIYFCKPTTGLKFAMVTWSGFIGCASGMNEAGLTVTINAAKSDIPTSSATPISLLAREILQYATSIDEAMAIAKKRETFVSESIMIGSAKDHATALIEKSPYKTALYRSGKHLLLCTNHYQSDSFKNDPNNIRNIATSASEYRYERLQELVSENPVMDHKTFAKILRDQKGKGGRDIGMGNEKAMNQLIAHHSVIFQPEKKRMWVSTAPYQLGVYICYDLDRVFAEAPSYKADREINDTSLTIAADSFLLTKDWKNFCAFKKEKEEIKKLTKTAKAGDRMDNDIIDELTQSNPESWESSYLAGLYLKSLGKKENAIIFFNQSLSKEINDSSEIYKIKQEIKNCSSK